jgi:hypothetical protein
MDSYPLKIVLTPALIGAASLAGRRWGPAVSGWLVGLPFTSAPIALFLAVDRGSSFAAAVAHGTLAGTISQALFCVAYGWLARRGGWPSALVGGCLAFAISTAALQRWTPPLPVLLPGVVGVLVLALRLMPDARRRASSARREPPRWDIPLRMAAATGVVLLLTGIAPALGPRLTGLLSPFPLYAAILTVFGHQFEGAGTAVSVLRGLLAGLFAFAGFFVAVAVLLERGGIVLAFGVATLVAFVLQAFSLLVIGRGHKPVPASSSSRGRARR